MPVKFQLVNTYDEQPWWIEVYLFDEVENLADVQQKLVKEGLELSLINPAFVPSALVLQFAATKALHAQSSQSLKCHSVYSELLYMLYPSTNMRQAFKTFGISPEAKSIVVVNYHCSSCNEASIKTLFKGKEIELSELPKYADEEKIKKLYGIGPEEIKISTLEQSLITRLVGKDYL
mmetsp:Transcript_109161/g.163275  ORF Transcript_109161/g.163275 Transcript_109161/m.163275 type:complete len:177 (+) Transcript_109161:1-531(+)